MTAFCGTSRPDGRSRPACTQERPHLVAAAEFSSLFYPTPEEYAMAL
jgi:hypothetical protein